jgi:7-cyano-7-deazaguanine synthase
VKAVVIFSGGLDSATCIAVAKQQGFEVHALTFNYQQRAQAEIDAAIAFCKQQGVSEHKLFDINIGQFKNSALTDTNIDMPITTESTEIPLTYVPARNTIFLSIALAWAEVLGANDIFYGANCVDYSNYPDCRPDYIQAFEQLANIATKIGVNGAKIKIHAPLLHLHKHEIIDLGHSLGVDYSRTVSCYRPTPEGLACRECPSCEHRMKGFARSKHTDPTRYI